jgi:SAM-dependent methyltransferase
LDVGCGAGAVLDRYKAFGWRTFGIEINGRAVAIARAKGHDVLEGDAAAAQLPEGAYDLVRATHSIEHVLEPTVLLRQLVNSLALNGLLYIDIPNLSSLPARLAGRDFWQLDPPRHLAIPHPNALRESLATLGLAPVASWTYSFGGSLAHSLWYATTWRGGRVGWRLSDPRTTTLRVASAILVPVAELLDLLGLGDSIRVIARRQPSAQ